MNVLVLSKRSFLETHGGSRAPIHKLDAGSRRQLMTAHRENRTALIDLKNHLRNRRIKYDVIHAPQRPPQRRYDLVISLGGDGTFFAAARLAGNTPILGINSAPSNSLGIWTGADSRDFRDAVDGAVAGTLPERKIWRMALSVGSRTLPELAFNDVLFCHRNPAAMSRYRLGARSIREEQRGSGLWVCTAAGSTAGIRSAGGRRMAIGSKKLQFRARELYTWPVRRYRLSAGTADRVTVTALTPDMSMWIDGRGLQIHLHAGDRVQLRPAEPLRVLGYDDRRRRKLFP